MKREVVATSSSLCGVLRWWVAKGCGDLISVCLPEQDGANETVRDGVSDGEVVR